MPTTEQSDDGGNANEAVGVWLNGIAHSQLDAVYRAEAPGLVRRLRNRVWSQDERHDLVQEAFTRLAESRSTAARRNPAAYLHGIVRHLLADRVRHWARAQSLSQEDLPGAQEPPGPDSAFEIAQMRELYRTAVACLPPRTREVYLLHRAQDLEYREIAETLCISIRTVEWHVAQAIMRISKSIRADG
jgi:RNA polymerase sigma-70 factor (ECF subfamily)